MNNNSSGIEYTDVVSGLASGSVYYVRIAARAQNPSNRYNMTKVVKVEL